MPKRHYSDRERAEALAALDSNRGNLTLTSSEIGIPFSTLKRWATNPDRAAPADLRQEAAIDFQVIVARMGLAGRPQLARSRPGPRATHPKGAPCVYLVACDGFFKIGLSTNLPGRLAAMQSSSPHEVVVDLVVAVSDRDAAYGLEQAMHAAVWHCHHRGEWFALDDAALAVVRRMMREAYEQATA